MNLKTLYTLAALPLALLMSTTNAATFEAVGTIGDVQLGRNLIVVDEITYSLPNQTAINGTPAILQLEPGYLIGFSGTEASPYPIIDSLYLYPESVHNVEQRVRP
ncbi:PilY2 family type 4a fimbrial biogenesis protein [Stutzerimonas nitrititolerans]|uniref:PilY2 family type 4a fimbrial biogenesis protein n=1 Tax=Stutzerimonas nitrititolerans TaxID=2482751 RepID=UPI0028AC4F83|nr:PilY2 family type 4a fimbrial biogenesis protein [Stutzerimonas nitrititolerans]